MLSTFTRSRSRRGFTMIELMIVIAIIGILAAILTPVMMRARFKSYHTACVQNERNLASALELYFIEERNVYPADLDQLTQGARPYIANVGDCPSNEASYTLGYSCSSDFTQYVLACPGVHDRQLIGLVDDTYPQAVNGAMYQYHAP